MSNTQFAFLKKSSVPGREDWQKAIDALQFGVRLQLDPELAPFKDEGFSPCKWGDTDLDVGFEIYYEPASDVWDGDDALKAIAGDDNDYCITMEWGGSMKDCAAVMIASTALAKGFGAVISYQGDAPDDLDTQIEDTRKTITAAEKET